jgi:nitrate/nitrite transporter NarK
MTIRTKNAIANARKFSTPGSHARRSIGMGMAVLSVYFPVPSHSIDYKVVEVLFALATLVHCKHATGGTEKMIRDIYFSHYRAIRGVVTTVVALGAAVLVSYFILSLGV